MIILPRMNQMKMIFLFNISDDEQPQPFRAESFYKDKRIMFPASNLTISDVMLMLKAITIKFGMPRIQKIALINFTKYLAGPEYNTFNLSPYKLDKYIAPPKDNVKKRYFCEECNESLLEMLVSEKKTIVTQCCICKKSFKITSMSENYFVYFDIKYQLQMLLNKKNIQQSMFDFNKE